MSSTDPVRQGGDTTAVVPAVPRLTGIVWLLLIATAFGTNHIAARLAFDHGVSVPTAVAARSLATGLFVFALLRHARVPLRLSRTTLLHGLVIGLLVALQSLCLAAAVARMPVALALLVFNTFPMVLAVLSWLSGGERPGRRTWIAMLLALLGLTLALGARPGVLVASAGHDYVGGTLLAFGASLGFGAVLLLTTRWLSAVDGRIRSLLMMTVVMSVTLIGGIALDGFRAPADATGWLGLGLLMALYAGAMSSLFVVLPRLGAVNNAAVLNFEPIAALGLGWLVLGQSMAPLQLTGAAVVIAAIVMLSTGRPR